MAEKIKGLGLNIWCYTGYTFEHIVQNLSNRTYWQILISNIDVLVDGRFEIGLKDENIRYRGSSNQRVVDVKESLRTNKIVTMY